MAHHPIKELTDIKRQHLYTYMDEMLTAGYASSTVNVYLSSFQATLQFMQGRNKTQVATATAQAQTEMTKPLTC